MAGLSDTGFTALRAADYIALAVGQFQALTGIDLSTRADSPLYLLISIVAGLLDGIGQAAQAVYDARTLGNATGTQLDNLGLINGVPRKAASYSTVTLTLKTTTSVPAGSLVSDSDGQRWVLTAHATLVTGTTTAGGATTLTSDYTTTQSYAGYQIRLTGGTGASSTWVTIVSNTIGVNAVFTVASWPGSSPDATTTWTLGLALVVAEPTATGPITGVAGTIATIVTPLSGWSAVTNVSDAVPGADIEGDAAYRVRIVSDRPNSGSRSPAALRATLGAIDGVTAAVVLSNPADATVTVSGVSMTAHSSAAIIWPDPVDDATKTAIFTAIYNHVAAGIANIGAVTGSVIDASGQSQAVAFGYASSVTVNVVSSVSLSTGYALADVEDTITGAVSAYLAGLTVGQSVYNLRVVQTIADALPLGIDSLTATLNGGSDVGINGNQIALLGTNTVVEV